MRAVYTDLDTIFDTRLVMLSALTQYGKKKIGNYNIKDYFTDRIRDNFGTLSDKIFHIYYKYRNKAILQHARPTYIVDIIKSYYIDLMEDIPNNPEANLYINIYPYNLTKDERDVILEVLLILFDNVNIHFLDINPLELDAKWVSDKIGMYVSYFTMDWLEYITAHKQFLKHPLINVIAIAPTRVKGYTISKNLNNKLLSELTMTFATIINIKFLSPLAFTPIPTNSSSK